MKKRYIWLFSALLLMLGCESLEDTYSDYAGDGTKRYVGKCTAVSVESGWKRLIVKWTNNVDPNIANIKITWALGDEVRDTLLPKDATECNITNLEDGNYEVTVSAVDRNGKASLSTPLFKRPYTLEHEAILSFTRLISKHYLLNERLVLFFTNWDSKIEEAKLYYMSGGERKYLDLDSVFVTDNRFHLLPDKIDIDSELVLERTGRVEDCEDLIVFEPDTLKHLKIYTPDFKLLAKSRYGKTEITEEWANEQTELEYDYSVSSFEDILNLPNLKKIILGKNRYLNQEVENDTIAFAKVLNMPLTQFVLGIAPEVFGADFKVERYGKHYFPEGEEPACLVDIAPYAVLPELQYLDNTDWETSCSWEDTEPYNSHLEYLFDGNPNSCWQPEFVSTMARAYEIEVDMKEKATVQGLVVRQKSFDPTDAQSRALMPEIIKIATSGDKQTWDNATWVEESTLGMGNGEITVIYFKEPISTQYLKFTLYDQLYGQNFSVSLAEIEVF